MRWSNNSVHANRKKTWIDQDEALGHLTEYDLVRLDIPVVLILPRNTFTTITAIGRDKGAN